MKRNKLILILLCLFFARLGFAINITSITSTAFLDGDVDNTGLVENANQLGYAGDYEGGAGNGTIIRAFLSFSLSSIPANANITSATLVLTLETVLGDPFTFGDLIVQHVNYSSTTNGGSYSLEASDWTNAEDGGTTIVYTSNLGAIRTNSLSGTTKVTLSGTLLKQAIQSDLDAGRTNSQFRLEIFF